MSEGPSTPLNWSNMANGSPEDHLRLEAARKRLEIERATSESESPFDAQIRRMTKELKELKKQRQLAELQEQILAERQLLEAWTHHRLSIAAASVSPKSSPAPAFVSSTPAVPTPPVPSFSPQTPRADAESTTQRINSLPTPLPSVSKTPVPSLPAPVQQHQTPKPAAQATRVQVPLTSPAQATNGQALPKAPSQAVGGQAQNSPVGVNREPNDTANQVQALSIPKVGNGFSQIPNGVAPSMLKQQQHAKLSRASSRDTLLLVDLLYQWKPVSTITQIEL